MATADRRPNLLMLPTGHIEFTWAALNLIQRGSGRLEEADYRLMALCAVLPDVIDKPLATFVMTDSEAALLFGHTALVHGAVWLTCAATGNTQRALPYLLAFSGHLLADRMWKFRQTLLWPLRGRQFHRWRHVGSPAAIVNAYLDIVRKKPLLVTFEVVGAGLLAWFVIDRELWRPERLAEFARTGRVI